MYIISSSKFDLVLNIVTYLRKPRRVNKKINKESEGVKPDTVYKATVNSTEHEGGKCLCTYLDRVTDIGL